MEGQSQTVSSSYLERVGTTVSSEFADVYRILESRDQ